MILVVGATGLVGRTIAMQLLAEGHRVRVLVRPGSDYAGLEAAGAEAVLGDLKDPASLAAACRSIATVVTTANSSMRGGEDTAESVDLHGNRALIEAAEAALVSQFVFVSALGVSVDSPVPFFRAKALTEQRLRESGMPHTILSPNLFVEIWAAGVVGGPARAGQPVTLVGAASRRHTFISMHDVARFAVACVGHPAAMNATLPLGGPDALTWLDVVDAYARILERPVETRFVAPGQPVPGLPEMMSGYLAALESYDSILDTQPLARTFGVELTPLESALRGTLVGA